MACLLPTQKSNFPKPKFGKRFPVVTAACCNTHNNQYRSSDYISTVDMILT
jgi:hypothetical protein